MLPGQWIRSGGVGPCPWRAGPPAGDDQRPVRPAPGAFPDYAGGLYALGSTTLVVSRGLCRNLLPRVFNPLSWWRWICCPQRDKAL